MEINKENLKKLYEYIYKFPFPGKRKGKLIATEDQCGIVYISTEKGTVIYKMPKIVYDELKKFKSP